LDIPPHGIAALAALAALAPLAALAALAPHAIPLVIHFFKYLLVYIIGILGSFNIVSLIIFECCILCCIFAKAHT
jgi:hypothetical protein